MVVYQLSHQINKIYGAANDRASKEMVQLMIAGKKHVNKVWTL